MANSTVGNPWVIDTAGVITTSPVKISKMVLIPNAAGDAAEFYYWYPDTTNSTYINDTVTAASTTVASASQIQSTGNFTATDVAAKDIIKITWTSTGNNLVSRLVASRDTDNQITVAPADLSNESGKTYSWTVYNGYPAAYLLAPATEKMLDEKDFGDGFWFPALALTSISASAKVHIYIA